MRNMNINIFLIDPMNIYQSFVSGLRNAVVKRLERDDSTDDLIAIVSPRLRHFLMNEMHSFDRILMDPPIIHRASFSDMGIQRVEPYIHEHVNTTFGVSDFCCDNEVWLFSEDDLKHFDRVSERFSKIYVLKMQYRAVEFQNRHGPLEEYQLDVLARNLLRED